MRVFAVEKTRISTKNYRYEKNVDHDVFVRPITWLLKRLGSLATKNYPVNGSYTRLDVSNAFQVT